MAKIVQTEGRTSSLLECYAEVQPIFCKDTKKSKQQFHLIPFFYFPPKDCPSGSHQTIFPQKSRNALLTQVFSHGFRRYAQIRRVWHPAIPTQPQNYLPTEFTHKIFWRRRKICVHLCASVGGPSTPETSVGSACSVGEPCASKPSVRICGRIFSARNFCVFCEIRGRTLRSLTICAHLWEAILRQKLLCIL